MSDVPNPLKQSESSQFGSTSVFPIYSSTEGSIIGGTSTGLLGTTCSLASRSSIGATSSHSPSSNSAFGCSSSSFTGSSMLGQMPTFGVSVSDPNQQTQSTSGNTVFGACTPIGASSQPAFAAAGTPAIGATNSAAFGATRTLAAGSSSTSTFGSTGTAFGVSNAPVFKSGAAFGASSIPAIGASSVPAFGVSSTPSVCTSSSSAFGASSTPGFNFASIPHFSQSTSTFGSTGTAFGVSNAPAFKSGDAFGASSIPAIGASSVPAFGVSSTPSVCTSSSSAFGASSTPGFNFASIPHFSQSTSAFGSNSLFGTIPSSFGTQASPFGVQITPQTFGSTGIGHSVFGSRCVGSRIAPYTTTVDGWSTEPAEKLQSISAMSLYKDKSHEELRWEDYQFGNQGFGTPSTAFGVSSTAGFSFPSIPTSSQSTSAAAGSNSLPGTISSIFETRSSPFGSSILGQMPTLWISVSVPNQPITGSAFQRTQSTSGNTVFGTHTPLGASSQPAFATAGTLAFDIAITADFGGTRTPAIGFSSASTFGSTGTAFGVSNPPAFGGGAFGAPSTSAFGATNTFVSGLGSSSAPSSGTSSSSGFGATRIPAVGSSSASTFGSTGIAFGVSNAPAFGGGAFGAPIGAPNAFVSGLGSSSAPSIGTSSSSGFGASSNPGFSFASVPNFSQSTSAFGNNSLFGTTPYPFGTQASPFRFQTTPQTFGSTGIGQSAFGHRCGGSRIAPYTTTFEGSISIEPTEKLQSISAMPLYHDKSHEELRWEDYQFGDKGRYSLCVGSPSTSGFGASTTAGFNFPPIAPFGQSTLAAHSNRPRTIPSTFVTQSCPSGVQSPAVQSAGGMDFNASTTQSNPVIPSAAFCHPFVNPSSSSITCNPFAPRATSFSFPGSVVSSTPVTSSSCFNAPSSGNSLGTITFIIVPASDFATSFPYLFGTSTSPTFVSSPSIFSSPCGSYPVFQAASSLGQTNAPCGQNSSSFGPGIAPFTLSVRISTGSGLGCSFSSTTPFLLSTSNPTGFVQTTPSFSTTQTASAFPSVTMASHQ